MFRPRLDGRAAVHGPEVPCSCRRPPEPPAVYGSDPAPPTLLHSLSLSFLSTVRRRSPSSLRICDGKRPGYSRPSPIQHGQPATPSALHLRRPTPPTFQGCNSSCFGNRNSIELEPGRCRRTDGKKWRCSRDVPDKKYCMQHMHRGAKRHAVASQTIPVPNASTVASHRASPSLSSSIPNKANLAIPNTDLSISIQASPPPTRHYEKSRR